jgi:hypothetical protein
MRSARPALIPAGLPMLARRAGELAPDRVRLGLGLGLGLGWLAWLAGWLASAKPHKQGEGGRGGAAADRSGGRARYNTP